MANKRIKILAVDDDPINLDILQEYFSDNDYEVVCASDGTEALATLTGEHRDTDIILLDRMMPEMNGIEFLKRVKTQQKLKDIPVIMQTAAGSPEQVTEGIEAGAYYYLTKPFDPQTMLTIVKSAAGEVKKRREFQGEINKVLLVSDIMLESRFRLRTLEQARNLALYLGKLCPNAERSSYGLSEVLINAVEHGLFELGYEAKSELLEKGEDALSSEIRRRSKEAEYSEKFVDVEYKKLSDRIIVTINDNGKGFNWKDYIDISPGRAVEKSGRGVALAKLQFDEMEYNSAGNEVKCTIMLEANEA